MSAQLEGFSFWYQLLGKLCNPNRAGQQSESRLGEPAGMGLDSVEQPAPNPGCWAPGMQGSVVPTAVQQGGVCVAGEAPG